MRKTTLSFLFVSLVSILPWSTFAQKAEWVEQVIIANGNKFETTPPFEDFVTVQTYNPVTGVTYIFDEIKTQSVQDVVIANNKIYVAAQDTIVMYDANTLQRLAAISDSGLSRLHIYNNRLIVAKQYPIKRFFVEVLSADDLSLIARVQDITGDCKGIGHTPDSVYVAVNGGFLSTESKIAVIKTSNWSLVREVNFGTEAVGINDIYNYNGTFFCINQTPSGSSDIGSVTAYDPENLSFTNYVFDLKVGNSASGVTNSGFINELLYLTLNNGIGSFDMNTRQIADTLIVPDPGYTNHIYFTSFTTDYVNHYFYANIGNGFSLGYDLVATTSGDSVTSFNTELNTEALALDYRVPVAVNEQKGRESTICLFPNPVVNDLRIIYTGDSPVNEILIRDITGRIVFHTTETGMAGTWINCMDYTSGLYFVTLKTDFHTHSAKFIKK